MKNAPNSKSNLDRALQRFAGDFARANDLRGQMANAIVAQMIGDGVVKGGSGLRFREIVGTHPAKRLFFRRLAGEKGEKWRRGVEGVW